MTQEFVTLPREVVEQALWALDNASTPHGKDWAEHGVARKALRAALDRLQAEHDPTPDGATHIQLQQGAFYKRVDGKWYVWSLMKSGEPRRWYISPGTSESCLEPLATTPKQKHEPLTIEQPQVEQPAMTPIAQRKLGTLLEEGYTISGYSVYHERRHQHGFVTGSGLVGWWKPEGVEYPQPQGEQDQVAEITGMDEYGPMLGWHKHWAEFPIGTKLYTHPQNLNCKSTQARLATLWGYVKEQTKREPLTDAQAKALLAELTGRDPACANDYNWDYELRIIRAIEAANDIK